jgi:DNA-binding transcriptional MerR regulator
MMTIGAAAKSTGIKVPTIRYYEHEGLLPAPARTASGRRLFDDHDLRRLTFIRHARQLGFEIVQIRALLHLADHPARPCGDADSIAGEHLAAVRTRLAQLRALEKELKRMIAACEGGAAQDCRIIEALSDHTLCRVGAH